VPAQLEAAMQAAHPSKWLKDSCTRGARKNQGPVVRRIEPALAKPGETITITGMYLDLGRVANNLVRFGGDISVRAARPTGSTTSTSRALRNPCRSTSVAVRGRSGWPCYPGRPELWVAGSGLDRISIIDTNRDQVAATFPVARKPNFLTFHPDDCYTYVFAEEDSAVWRLLPNERKVDGEAMRPRQRMPARDLTIANGAVNLVYVGGGGEAWPQSCEPEID